MQCYLIWECMPKIRLIGSAVKSVKKYEHTQTHTETQIQTHTDCNLYIYIYVIYIYIYILEFWLLRSQNYSKATAPGSSNSNCLTILGVSIITMVKSDIYFNISIITMVTPDFHFNILRYLAEKLVWPEMTFNDLEGQNHIAYSAIPPNMSMHAKNQVNPCSG